MVRPAFDSLSPELQKVFDPTKEKTWIIVAKGLAPLPPPIMIQAWAYMLEDSDTARKESAAKSLQTFPQASLVPVLKSALPTWALDAVGELRQSQEDILEAILLNEGTSNDFVLRVSKTCSERMTTLIVNNQERIIDCPAIVPALESNPHNLKSNTDRLRHFLRLAGITIPGDQSEEPSSSDVELMVDEAFLMTTLEGFDDDEKMKRLSTAGGSGMSDEQRKNLLSYIQTLSIGGRVKLALKGNKEARGYLVRDTNKVVALAVLKSPRITDNEVAVYASMRNISEDVVRAIAVNPVWTKGYPVKIALCFHPKTPLQNSMGFMKFLNMRDLGKLSKDKNIPGALSKASKQLLQLKRK